MSYKFDWRRFDLDRFEIALRKMSERRFSDWCVGCVRVGVLCFDLVLRDYGADALTLDYDLYVGGVDDGYGYADGHYPYTYAEGGSLMVPPTAEGRRALIYMYEDFKSSAEKVFTEYINDYGMYDLPAKAAMPLRIW